MNFRRIGRAGLLALALAYAPRSQEQTVHFATGRPNAAAPLALLGVTLTATPAIIGINLVSGGLSAPSDPVTLTLSWGLLSLNNGFRVYAFFATPDQALVGQANGQPIAASRISAIVPTGNATAYTPFTTTNPITGSTGSVLLLTQGAGVLGTLLPGSRTDVMNLKVDMTGLGAAYNADTYSGTLTIQAQSF